MKKRVGLIARTVALVVIISLVLGMNISCDKMTKTITLTRDNFNDFFTYEVTGQWYNGRSGDGEITVTFSPWQNLELKNAEIAITIYGEIADDVIIYEVIDGSYHYHGVTRHVKIPFDGKFSVKFSDYGDSSSGVEQDFCQISWYGDTPLEQIIDVIITSASGTIILK